MSWPLALGDRRSYPEWRAARAAAALVAEADELTWTAAARAEVMRWPLSAAMLARLPADVQAIEREGAA